MSEDVDLNTKALRSIIKAFKESPPEIRVGILGSSKARSGSAEHMKVAKFKKLSKKTKATPLIVRKGWNRVMTNAEIGALHEFGSGPNTKGGTRPMRSFLRVPIIDNMQKYLDKNGAFDKDKIIQVIKEGQITIWAKKIAITAEEIVADAFDSGGFGKWPASNMKLKKNHQTLVETQQLRNSVTSEVK